MSRRNLFLLAFVFLAGAAIALGGFALLGRDHATAAGPRSTSIYGTGYGMMGGAYGNGNGNGYGPGMMGGTYGDGYGPGMMGGGYGAGMMGSYGRSAGSVQSSVTAADLAAVRDRVETQLLAWGYKGFKVGEIMAFSNNDYVLVEDTTGKPAFELLADPNGRWLVPEPGPNMMWNTNYGMMRGISVPGCPWAATSASGATGSHFLTAAQAKTRADAWLSQQYAGRVTADATALPGYFTIDVTQDGQKVGMLSVNQTTGAVWYHTWHATFLADQDF